MHFKDNLISFIITIILSAIIFFLITKQLIYPTIPPMVKNGVSSIFLDWSVILSANLCKSRVDVYLDNPCDIWNRAHVYGNILLNIPFVKKFLQFYFLIFPIIINFLFIYVVVSFFKFKRSVEYLTIIPFIFSIPVLLLIERANIDNIIFLLIFLIAIYKNLFSNYFLIIFATLSKFYPIVLMIIFLFQKNIKKIFFHSAVLLLIALSILYFELEGLKKIFENSKQFTASPHLSFSFTGFIKHLSNLKIVFQGKDFNWIKNIYILIILIVPLIITLYFYIKIIFSDTKIKELFLNNCFENRIYVLSSTVVLFCYFSFSNYIYREIFFLGLLPWLINLKKINSLSTFFNFYYYALVGKFFLSTILIYMYRNHLTLFKPVATITKHCLDFYLIFIVLLVLVSGIYSFTKILIQKNEKHPLNL